ncbi:hypothetical protein ACNKHT_14445 [Shigella flexneri]
MTVIARRRWKPILGYWLNGTRAGESQRGCSPGRAGGYVITKEGDSFNTSMSPQFKSFLISEKN